MMAEDKASYADSKDQVQNHNSRGGRTNPKTAYAWIRYGGNEGQGATPGMAVENQEPKRSVMDDLEQNCSGKGISWAGGALNLVRLLLLDIPGVLFANDSEFHL